MEVSFDLRGRRQVGRTGTPLFDTPAVSSAVRQSRPVALRTGLAAGVPLSEGEISCEALVQAGMASGVPFEYVLCSRLHLVKRLPSQALQAEG